MEGQSIIYDINTGEILSVWSGMLNTHLTVYENPPENYNTLILNNEIVDKKENFLVKNGLVELKPLIHFSLDNAVIYADGIDTSRLTINVTDTNKVFNSINIKLNSIDTPVELVNNQGVLEIASLDPIQIIVKVDAFLYRCNEKQLYIEVINRG